MENVVDNKFLLFNSMLKSGSTHYLMEAHNAISAKIVEEIGFSAIWASGLAISSSLGVRDRNEISWTQVLDVVEYMSDATTIPILLDGDTGYGDFNNFSRLVKKLVQRNIAAVCIEDKIFPKINSFLANRQELVPISDFTSKIRAGQDAKTDSKFSIIARTEALIAGLGVDEALRRIEAYYEAGADGVLIHSKSNDGSDVLEAISRLKISCPILIVPTKYYSVPTRKFVEAGVSGIIWANHTLRASVTGMRNILQEIFEHQSLISIEPKIEPISGLFKLSGEYALAELEKKYLTEETSATSAVILAATRGDELEPYTVDRPKCLIEINGTPIIEYSINALIDRGIDSITVVSGYAAEGLNLYSVETRINEKHASTGELYSLLKVIDKFDRDLLISYGDLVLSEYIFDILLKDPREGVILIVDPELPAEKGDRYDYVVCDRHYSPNPLKNASVFLTEIKQKYNIECDGVRVGIMRITSKYAKKVRAILEEMSEHETFSNYSISDLLSNLISRNIPLCVCYIKGGWVDVNTIQDLEIAKKAKINDERNGIYDNAM